MDGISEWTEIGAEQGLDHLAMLSPVEAHYQSLLRGFSSVTTRLRNYSFYAYWVAHYKRQVRNDARRVFEDRTRRVEALYALAASQQRKETGVAVDQKVTTACLPPGKLNAVDETRTAPSWARLAELIPVNVPHV